MIVERRECRPLTEPRLSSRCQFVQDGHNLVYGTQTAEDPMTRLRTVLAILLALLATAAVARVISYSPYTDRTALPRGL